MQIYLIDRIFEFKQTSQALWSTIHTSGTGYQGYHQVSNIRRTLVGNKLVDHSDVVGASPVGAAPTTSSFST